MAIFVAPVQHLRAAAKEDPVYLHTTKIKHISEDRAILDAIDVVDQVSHVVLVARSDPGSMGPCEEGRGY